MKVNVLCKKLGLRKVKNNHEIFLITDDSRDCINNSIFFAIYGDNIDGHNKIEEAIENGSKTIVLEKKVNEKLGINYIYCKNSKRLLALFLREYHNKILKKLEIIGVIGTNGKTTTSTLIYKYFQYVNKSSMLIGSNGCYAKDFYRKHSNTTPKCVELYNYFSYAYQHGIQYIVMEVSSIAVSELRVLDIPYHLLVFTNFSEDHLDYHKTMDKYLFAKMIPFYKLTSKDYAVINLDDSVSSLILKHTNAKVITYGIMNFSEIQGKNIYSTETGIEFDIDCYNVKSNLLGSFNVYNILPLFAIAKIFHLDKFKILPFLKEFRQVEGRMNAIPLKKGLVIIDYAHTEEAIRNAILEAKCITKGKVLVVVGCGGNREKEKRKKIGKLLSNMDCIPIITSDNPRYEKPMDIINDILSGIKGDVTIIENRKEAITYALNQLNNNDILLILGKGCEDYIEINGHKEKYSDFNVIENYRRDNF